MNDQQLTRLGYELEREEKMFKKLEYDFDLK
jgi:hypothetical protein